MKYLGLMLVLLLAGCAGVTEYTISTPDGVIVNVRNSKDYESYSLSAKKQADGSYSVILKETGVSATNPMSVMSKALSEVIKLVPTK